MFHKPLTAQLAERYNESMRVTWQQAEEFVSNCADAEWFGWDIAITTRTAQGAFRKIIAADEKGFFNVSNEYAGLLKKPGNRPRNPKMARSSIL